MALVWLSLPPAGLWPLAYLALVPWTLLVRVPNLPFRRPGLAFFGIGFGYWLLQTQWVRLPHWSAPLGWIALAAALAVYVWAFFAMSRALVHRWRWPAALAVPVVWAGVELARGHVLTGFSLALLGHSQVDCLPILQLADWGGAYAVSFLVALVGAALAAAWPGFGPRSFKPLVAAGIALAAALGYGTWRLNEAPPQQLSQATESSAAEARPLHVAIVQGSLDTEFNNSPEYVRQIEETFNFHLRTSLEAAQQQPNLDVILWPENMFNPWAPLEFEEPVPLPPEIPPEQAEQARRWFHERYQGVERARRDLMAALNGPSQPEGRPRSLALVVGSDFTYLGQTHQAHYNSALWISAEGEIAGRYDKMHPVMFGEYVPLGDVFPWLYRLTPMSGGLTPGRQPRAFAVAGYRLSPSVCFESTVPHLIRRQARQLAAQGEGADVLVNVTNDGWFWGSSLLDLHLACNIFRAVELRKPTLVAANTGVSAVIDGCGRVQLRGPKRQTDLLVAAVVPDGRVSPYFLWGDVPAGLCLAISLVFSLWRRRSV